MQTPTPPAYPELLQTLKEQIRAARVRAALAVNRELVLLYYAIGTEILRRQRSEGWGTSVIARLSVDLRREFPGMRGLSTRNLGYMRKFAEAWDNPRILQQVAAQLPWFHNCVLLDKIEAQPYREWYARACIEHGWSRSILEMQIETGFLERTFAATSNFDRTLPPEQSDLARQTIRDPFCFDFLAMTGRVKEKDLESGLVSHIRDFLLELGTGFAFVGSQYPLKVSNREYRLDLLFYHLRLRCYLIVELKACEFRPEDSGKMSFYLAAADDLLRHPSDNRTIGMILCRDKDRIVAEYALRESTSPLGVAQFSLHRQLAAEFADKLPSVERIEESLWEAELSDRAGVIPQPSRDPPSRPVSRGDPPQS